MTVAQPGHSGHCGGQVFATERAAGFRGSLMPNSPAFEAAHPPAIGPAWIAPHAQGPCTTTRAGTQLHLPFATKLDLHSDLLARTTLLLETGYTLRTGRGERSRRLESGGAR